MRPMSLEARKVWRAKVCTEPPARVSATTVSKLTSGWTQKIRRHGMSGKIKVLSFTTALAVLLTTGTALFAHHGDAAYSSNSVELKDAVVTEYRWQNPHSLIKVRAKTEKGEDQVWTMEMGSTPSMA